MALTLEQKNKIIDEVFNIDVMIHLKNGKPVYRKDSKAKEEVFIYDDDNNAQVQVDSKTDFVHILYNQKIKDDIRRTIPILLKARKIIAPETITENTPSVKKALLKSRRRSSAFLTEEEKYIIIEEIRQQYEAQYTLAIFQVVAWAMIRNYIFYFDKNKQMLTDFEIEIEKDYWDKNIVEKPQNDPLFDMLNVPDNTMSFERDKTNPLEIQIAIITSLINNEDYSKFSDVYSRIIGAVIASLGASTNEELGDIDDEGMFRSELRWYLPEFLRGVHSDK